MSNAYMRYRPRTMTVREMMHSTPFRMGFDDVRHGLPYRYDMFKQRFEPFSAIGAQQLYEKGRHFARVYRGKLDDYDAVPAFVAAVNSKTVI